MEVPLHLHCQIRPWHKKCSSSSSVVLVALQQHPWLKGGNRYLKKDENSIDKFLSVGEAEGFFELEDIYGQAAQIQVPREEKAAAQTAPPQPEVDSPFPLLKKKSTASRRGWGILRSSGGVVNGFGHLRTFEATQNVYLP